jgi:hypothetical protein
MQRKQSSAHSNLAKFISKNLGILNCTFTEYGILTIIMPDLQYKINIVKSQKRHFIYLKSLGKNKNGLP